MAEIDKQKHLVDLIGDLTSERSLRGKIFLHFLSKFRKENKVRNRIGRQLVEIWKTIGEDDRNLIGILGI